MKKLKVLDLSFNKLGDNGIITLSNANMHNIEELIL